MKRPRNLIFVLPDEWRASATTIARDPNVRTPALDHLAAQSVRFTHAVSGTPVCSAYRATLISGMTPLNHGVFLNDVALSGDFISLGDALRDAGYATGWIGKWHLDGPDRWAWTPPDRRRGFEYWRAHNLCHDPFAELYYADDPQPRFWEGWAPRAQTADALSFAADRVDADEPFALFLSWGPPHDPLLPPPSHADRFAPGDLTIRGNVPAILEDLTRTSLAAYYATCTALDACLGNLLGGLRGLGIERDTLVVWTSDHGTMLGSQGNWNKQQPWDESIRVPLLMRWPAGLGAREVPEVVDSPDLMPTLLGLCGAIPPASCEGRDLSGALVHDIPLPDEPALLQCIFPFGRWSAASGGREYRGIRTKSHSWVRDLSGPWLLYDNVADPLQQNNLVDDPGSRALAAELDEILQERMGIFRSGAEHRDEWGYRTDASGAVATTFAYGEAGADPAIPTVKRLQQRMRAAGLDRSADGWLTTTVSATDLTTMGADGQFATADSPIRAAYAGSMALIEGLLLDIDDRGSGPAFLWQALQQLRADRVDLSEASVRICGIDRPFSADEILNFVQPHRDPRWLVRAWATRRLEDLQGP